MIVVQKQASEATELARVVAELKPAADSVAETAEKMAKRERLSGAISGKGGGRGIVTDTLATIATAAKNTKAAITKARAQARPIVRRIEALSARIRQVADDPNMDAAQKISKAKVYMAELTLSIEALRRTVPTASILSLFDALSKDFESIGLNDQASAAIRETFTPISMRFLGALGDIQQRTETPVARFVELSGFALLKAQLPAILPIAIFVLLLDFLPLVIVFLVLVLSRPDRGSEQHAEATTNIGDQPFADQLSPAKRTRTTRKHAVNGVDGGVATSSSPSTQQ